MDLNESGIYKITCVVNNKFYIGSSVRFIHRWNEHKSELRRNVHINGRLQNSWNKYGESSFVFSIIQIVPNLDELCDVEQSWMDSTKCYDRNIGFNISKNAQVPMLGRFGELNPFFGKKHTAKTRQQMSEAAKKRTASPQERQRLSNMNKGRKLTKKVKDQMSKSHTGMKRSEDSKIKTRGTNHFAATINEGIVRDMRTEYKRGVSIKAIAAKYGVSYFIAYDTAKYRSWKHVE